MEAMDLLEEIHDSVRPELENADKLREDAQKVFKSEEKLKKYLINAEKGINREFAEKIDVCFLSDDINGNPEIILPALSLALVCKKTHHSLNEVVDTSFETEYASEVIDVSQGFLDSTPLSKVALASYNKNKNMMIFGTFPDQEMPEIRTATLKPLKTYIDTRKGLEEFVSTMNHEVTHAYINQRTGGYETKEAYAVDEAAAHAVQNLILGRKQKPKFHTRGYEEEHDLDRGITHTALHIFLEVGWSEDSRKKGARKVRELAVGTLNEHTGEQEILKVLRAKSDSRDFHNLEQVARELMKAEGRSLSCLLSLKVLDREMASRKFTQFIETFENILEEEGHFHYFTEEDEIETVQYDIDDLHDEISKIYQHMKSQGRSQDAEKIDQLKKDFAKLAEEFHSEEELASKWIDRDDEEIKKLQKLFMDPGVTKRMGKNTEDSELQENLLKLLVEKMKMTKAGLNQADEMLSVFRKIHEDEQKVAEIVKEYYTSQDEKEVHKLIEMTEEDYNEIKNIRETLENVLDDLSETRKTIKNQ